jgi:hypothetical protein
MSSADDTKKLLVKFGFIKGKSLPKYQKNKKGFYELKEGGGVSADDANVEMGEEVNVESEINIKYIKGSPRAGKVTNYIPTGVPVASRRFRLIMESSTAGIEEPYFWVLEDLRQAVTSAFPYIEKITDVFGASEQSAFWGAAQQRIGIQQDRVSQYMKGVSEMVKQLFQLVREMRVLDEKLRPRHDWGKFKAADIALKGEYTDLVENKGGQVAPGSIYHLAQTVGYAVLPDLFFNTQVYKVEDIDRKVDELKFNQNVRHVLRRKLYAFVNWKVQTDKELESRRLFTLRYLRQHWNTIKMYMNWIKPYLKNIARLQMSQEMIDSPDIVSAFETSMIELEILAYRPSKSGFHPCVLATFKFRTRPELSFQKDQYAHKGPSHVGRMEMTLRSYGWTKENIENYKKFKKEEDMMLLGMVDESVKAAMEALGEELEKYLAESGEREFEEKQKEKEAEAEKKKKQSLSQGGDMLDPFMSIIKGFGEMFSLVIPSSLSSGAGAAKSKSSAPQGDGSNEAKIAANAMWQTYKNFKKAHAMLSW